MRKYLLLLLLCLIPLSVRGASVYLYLKVPGTAAVITNLQGTPNDSTHFTCTWTTDVTTTANKCYYGTSPNPATTYCSDANNTAHTCQITGTAQTKYYFNASSTNGAYITVSSDSNVTLPPTANANVGKWIMDEGSGTTVADASGNGYTLTFGATPPTWSTTVGQVCDTGGIVGNGSSASASTSGTKLNNLTQWTVCGVLYCTGWGGNGTGTGRILSKETAAEFDGLYIDTNQSTGSLLVQLYNYAGTSFVTYGAANSFSLNQRTPVCITYDDLGDRKVHIYQSGSQISYGAQPAVTGNLATTANDIYILNNAAGTRGAACTLDNLYIDSGVASGATITARAGECSAATGTTYYISPSGSDSAAGTSAAPWKTYPIALGKLAAGDTLIQKANTTYTEVNSTNGCTDPTCLGTSCKPTSACPGTVLTNVGTTYAPINIDCSAGTTHCNGHACAKGTAAKPILVKCETAGTCWIQSQGDNPAVLVKSCNYWTVQGFHGVSADLDSAHGGYQASIFTGTGTYDNIYFKNNIADHTNRCFNDHCGLFEATGSNSAFDNNECYDYHRWSFVPFLNGLGPVLFHQNYQNSRNYPRASTAACDCNNAANAAYCAGTAPNKYPNAISDIMAGGGDFGVGSYNGTLVKLIDNIAERAQSGGLSTNGAAGQVSYLYGGITIHSGSAEIVNASDGDNETTARHVIRDLVGVLNTNGEENQGGNYDVKNITILSGTGVGVLTGNNNSASTKNIVTNCVNCLMRSNGSWGFRDPYTYNATVCGSAPCNNTYSCDYCNSTGNGNGGNQNFSPNDSHITHSNTNVPTLIGTTSTNCVTYIPAGSNMKNAGIGGNTDIGANMAYFHNDDGTISATSQWTAVTGVWKGCSGGTVTNLNNDATGATVATEACINVNQRLNMKAGGCPIP